MDFNDPSSYISIISSILLIISEVIPFLPCNSNGIIDTFFKISPCCGKKFKIYPDEIIKKNRKATREKKIVTEHMLYDIIDNLEDIECNIKHNDIKLSIKNVINYINNTY